MAGRDFFEFGNGFATACRGMRAARVKGTARWGIQWRWDLALNRRELAAAAADVGDLGQQRLGIGMIRACKDFGRGGAFDDLAQIHDRNAVRDMFDHA